MNIFILSSIQDDYDAHIKECASFHCDKHVVKMILEYTQIIVSVIDKVIPDHGCKYFPCGPLSKSHMSHPCVIWAGQSRTNLKYLISLAVALCDEKIDRYPLAYDHAYTDFLSNLDSDFCKIDGCDNIPHGNVLPTHFAVAVKDAKLRSTSTPHLDAALIYRAYYIKDKLGFARWYGSENIPFYSKQVI